MIRFAKYYLAFAALAVTCWAQVSLSLATPVHGIPPEGAAGASKPILAYNGIQYNDGTVMSQVNGVNFYFIWWQLDRKSRSGDPDRLHQ